MCHMDTQSKSDQIAFFKWSMDYHRFRPEPINCNAIYDEDNN